VQPSHGALCPRSIAYGIIAGLGSYIAINGTAWLIMQLSGGRIVPAHYEYSEEWVVPPGGLMPVWL
jgi:adenine/guanine/hypoxanthine permease